MNRPLVRFLLPAGGKPSGKIFVINLPSGESFRILLALFRKSPYNGGKR